MNIFSRLFSRRKEDSGNQQAAITAVGAAIAGEAQRSNLTEQEMEQALGINFHMLQDAKLLDLLEGMAVVKNEKGESVGVDLDAVAMRMIATPLIRASWLDEEDAIIGMLEAERMAVRMEMGLDEDSYESGGTNVLDAFTQVVRTGYCDSVNGRKARLLKQITRQIEVQASTEQKKAM